MSGRSATENGERTRSGGVHPRTFSPSISSGWRRSTSDRSPGRSERCVASESIPSGCEEVASVLRFDRSEPLGVAVVDTCIDDCDPYSLRLRLLHPSGSCIVTHIPLFPTVPDPPSPRLTPTVVSTSEGGSRTTLPCEFVTQKHVTPCRRVFEIGRTASVSRPDPT